MLDTCHMNSVNDLALCDRVLVAQWIERPLGVREVIRSILVANTEFFIFSLSKTLAIWFALFLHEENESRYLDIAFLDAYICF